MLPTIAMVMLLAASALAAPTPVPDCIGRRCGQTTVKTLDIRVAVVRARVTWSADDIDTMQSLYATWAEEEEYTFAVQESSRVMRVLRLRPVGGSQDDETVVNLEVVESGGTDVSLPLPPEIRRRPPPLRAPRWIPKCGGCQLVSRFDHGESQVVMLEGGGTPSHGMRRQVNAMRAAGWQTRVQGERPRFPTEQVSEEFYDGDRACMAVSSRASSHNRFHISLMCARSAGGR